MKDVSRASGRLAPVAALSLSALQLFTAVAGAQPLERNSVDTLYQQGQQLLGVAEELGRTGTEPGRAHRLVDKACKKLSAALRQRREMEKRGNGTGINFLTALALCRSMQGRTATAWFLFREAKALHGHEAELGRHEPGRGAYLEKQIAALAPKLAYLTVIVDSQERTDGLKIYNNGEELPSERLGIAIAVDPGKHHIRVVAPRHPPYLTIATIAEGERKTVLIPARFPQTGPSREANPPKLAKTAGTPGDIKQPPSPKQQQPYDDGMPAGQIVAIVAIGVGVAAGGGAGAFGGLAWTQWKRSRALCPQSPCADKEGATIDDTARRNQDISLGLGIAGGAAVVSGVVLWFAAAPERNDDASRVQIVPWLEPHGVGLTMEGRF